MEHFVALYEAFTGQQVLPMHIPLVAEQLKLTIRNRLLSNIPTTIILIPTGYALIYLASRLSDWRRERNGENRRESASDENLGLRRTNAHHDLHAYFMGEEEATLDMDDALRLDRTVEWVNCVRQTRHHCEHDDEDAAGSADSDICDSCIFCISDSDFDD